ncbi:DUF882 domain-containing protein [Ideonella sp. B508-1]|uniref:DUF882 domain-containing protein n=1 Tax=Ideonella sp. B508-1 TaxID=137716 RepID=UPI000347BBA6|nr:DUF882 domain-containing protein [Ideonella sp. B508-1]
MSKTHHPDRRRFLHRSAGLAAGAVPALVAPRQALASLAQRRELAFYNTHTQERVDLVYAVGDQFLPDSLATLNHFLRDHYSGQVGVMDPHLFDLLHQVRSRLGSTGEFEVISGYRCPTTNATLKSSRGGGVATNSLHMVGQAIDIRLPGVPLTALRDAALSLQGGGVGFYPREQFVHVDTGRVRRW